MSWQASGVMVKVWPAPQFTATAPAGEMSPPVPAEAVMVKVLRTKLAEMGGVAVTPGKVWLDPQSTATGPAGEIAPFWPADAAIVSTSTAKLAAMVWLAITLVKV